jgi:FeS assembly SUF system protein
MTMTEEVTQINPDIMDVIKDKVKAVLESIYDPEIPVNIYELGLIYDIQVSPFADVHVTMTLTSPNCPVAGSLPGDVKAKVSVIPEVKSADVEITFDPPWTQDMMSEEAKLELGFM